MELFIALPVIGAYLALTALMMRWAERSASRRGSAVWALCASMLVFVAAMAIPFGDHIMGWYYFKSLCKDAGTQVYRVVDAVPGLRWGSAGREAALKYGYRFIEDGERGGVVTRYTVESNGVKQQENTASISRYSAGYAPAEAVGMHVDRQDYVIFDDQAAERLAIHRTFIYRGGWLFRAVLAHYSGVAAKCPGAPGDTTKLVTTVLRAPKGGK